MSWRLSLKAPSSRRLFQSFSCQSPTLNLKRRCVSCRSSEIQYSGPSDPRSASTLLSAHFEFDRHIPVRRLPPSTLVAREWATTDPARPFHHGLHFLQGQTLVTPDSIRMIRTQPLQTRNPLGLPSRSKTASISLE